MQHNSISIDIEEEEEEICLAYHFVQEGVARDERRTAYVNTHENLADLFTKPLSGPKRAKFVRMVLHHLYPELIIIIIIIIILNNIQNYLVSIHYTFSSS